MNETEKQFCEELQELLDRYKTILFPPAIMRNAQRIFHNTLSIRHHPELYPQGYIEEILKHSKGLLQKDHRQKIKWQAVDEFHDMKEKGEL